MRAKFVFEKFTEESDPIRDMGISASLPEIILEEAIELFGDTLMTWRLTPAEIARLKGSKTDLAYNLPVSNEGWKKLKEVVGKPIDSEYKQRRRIPYVGQTVTDLNFSNLLRDIYGGAWYFDGLQYWHENNMVCRLKSIGETFKELMEKVKKFLKLEKINNDES